MRAIIVALLLVAALPAHTAAQTSLGNSVGNCFAPDDPYPYKLGKTDPLYDTARDEHQRHLEDMEKYVNCLDRERGIALDQFKSSFDLFLKNFGKDAVLQYDAERADRQ